MKHVGLKLAASLAVTLTLTGCYPSSRPASSIYTSDDLTEDLLRQRDAKALADYNAASFSAQQQVNMMNANPARFGGR